MGYLQLLSGVPPSTQFVISFWFRVPGAVLAQATTDYTNANTGGYVGGYYVGPPPIPPMVGVVPLITFGSRDLLGRQTDTGRIATEYVSSDLKRWQNYVGFVDVGTGGSNLYFTGQKNMRDNPANPLDPSYIGVNCRGSTPKLDFRFAFPAVVVPTVQNAFFQEYHQNRTPTVFQNWGLFDYSSPARGSGAPATVQDPITHSYYIYPYLSINTRDNVWTDDSDPFVTTARPEAFQALSYSNGSYISRDPGMYGADVSSSGIPVVSDKWHHILISMDMTNDVTTAGRQQADAGKHPNNSVPQPPTTPAPGTISSSANVHLSYDATNRVRKSVSYYADPNVDNGVLTSTGAQVFSTYTGANGSYIPDLSHPAPPAAFGNGSTFGFIDSGLGVPSYDFTPPAFDMGTITIPGDSTFTQHVEMAELQIFSGVTLDTSSPSNRALFVSGGKPAPSAGAVAALGKMPDVYLGSPNPKTAQLNWITGINLGTGGNFGVFGTILRYTIDPAIGA